MADQRLKTIVLHIRSIINGGGGELDAKDPNVKAAHEVADAMLKGEVPVVTLFVANQAVMHAMMIANELADKDKDAEAMEYLQIAQALRKARQQT
jgi:hypothetical protein